MSSDRSILEREMQRLELRPFTLEGFHRRRQRKERNRRIGTAVAALAIVAAAFGGLARALTSGRGPIPADQPPYEFLDGEVTFQAAPPWHASTWVFAHGPTWTTLGGPYEGRVRVMADPLPIETGCGEGPAPADAEALARSIRSDPDLETTEPVAVRIAGIEALRMDVVAVTGASNCQALVLLPGLSSSGDDLDRGDRMRLYLLDLPEGISARILALVIVAPEARFEEVVAAARPIVDSFEFHTG
jgi:hypothetical protein